MQTIPQKLVVLTFDDAVKNHLSFVAPLLQQYGFTATFFISEVGAAGDERQQLTWDDISTLHTMGFEIGNHTAHHASLGEINQRQLLDELRQIEDGCRQWGVAQPITFCYPGCVTAAWAFPVLRERGYHLARIGGDRPYRPAQDDPLLVPSFNIHGDDSATFYAAIAQATAGQAVVLMFHGVPDLAHPWVSIEPALFEEYLRYLQAEGYTAVAFRDLLRLSCNAASTAPAAPPFWRGERVDRETVFFIQNEGQPSAPLLFAPTAIERVTSADGRVEYLPETDYSWCPGTRMISLPPTSRIPYKTAAEMTPLPGAVQGIEFARDGEHLLFFSEGHVFHDRQIDVTYQHQDHWDGFVPQYAGDQLPRTLARLSARQPLKLVVLGDSISEGYNASAFTLAPPCQLPYAWLVGAGLEAHYGSPVTITNFSVAGTDSLWARSRVDAVIAEDPDLVILAYGMNDVSYGVSPETFQQQIAEIISNISARCPLTEFILVATMTGNSAWTGSNPCQYPLLRDALASLTKTGIILADMTSLWTDLLKHKRFADLTGNGVNHPNDFGHRLYRDALLQLLIAE